MPGKILLHACCGPCSLMPVRCLREEGFEVVAWFFNPNIHPQDEYQRRRQAMAEAAERLELPVLWEARDSDAAQSGPEMWVRGLAGELREGARCLHCYRQRLELAARTASQGFAAFTTSLLYSRYQRHDDIAEIGRQAAEAAGTVFVYRDFRPWWQQGIALSKEFGLYRQKWCGCILSKGEAERQRAERQAVKAARALGAAGR